MSGNKLSLRSCYVIARVTGKRDIMQKMVLEYFTPDMENTNDLQEAEHFPTRVDALRQLQMLGSDWQILPVTVTVRLTKTPVVSPF